ncbi:MAG: hypothetical protein ACRENS_13300 [Candidatus Eiseniibacteriota bacterium]
MNAARRWAASLLLALGAVSALIGLLAPPSGAMPRYSARYQQQCALCHVNPTGGGLRTAYASQKLVPKEIAWSKGDTTYKMPDPMIGKQLLIGTDFREMHVGSDQQSQRLDFFLMQADLYFAFALEPRVTLYYDRGRFDSYELFGLGYLRPTVFLKAGRFVPSYGWKFDDHTMYVRGELGFMPPANSDVGVEAGWSPASADIQVDVVNGSRGSTSDTDPGYAESVNGVYRWHVGPVGAAIGGSGYHHPTTLQDEDTYGPYGYLTYQRVTWIGEGDIRRQRDKGSPYVESVVASHELSYALTQGFDLMGTYDFFDPDRKHGTGAKSRWGGGLFFMPRPYMTLQGIARRTTYENGVAYSGTDFWEYLFQLHLLY